ncbi:hypothetical protein [Streptomyces sp. NPDC001068]|uniref:hypothetical protein n=1 Tax=Streptomyces sp. NPDC001068 TaxID=3364544 RepID=UPI00369E088F
MSGAAPTPRVDVETLLLCDVLPDGTVAGLALVEPVYDTVSGDRVGTRIVSPTTGAAYTPTGTLGLCSPPDTCTRQISTVHRCDDTDADGEPDTQFTEVWALDPCDGGAPVLVGTFAADDYSTPYTPVAPVDCPDATADTPVVLGQICYDAGAGETRTAAVLKCAACGDPTVTYLDVETGATVTAPTVVPCAAQESRAQLLCDVATDGTSTAFLRTYTIAPDGATTHADTALDGTTPYTVTGTAGACLPVSDCASPTTPTATVGLCLADGTPIAVTIVRDCEGVITSSGWINALTGAYSAGAPPAGAMACGESQSIQLSGTFCDVLPDGTVVGLVLIEYSYDAEGAIDSVRLVDAVTGTTYTPTGTVTVCPAGVEQPERDLLQLCDTAADGTVTAFVRDYGRDENGTITGHSDYLLDGTAYTPVGTVGTCTPPCLTCETIELCDSAPGSCAPVTGITDVPYAPRYVLSGDGLPGNRRSVPGGGAGFWSGASTIFPNQASDPDPGNSGFHLGIVGLVQVPDACPACLQPGDQVTITASGQATNNGPGNGIITDGRWRIIRDGGEADGSVPNLVVVTDANRAAGTTWSFSVTTTVPWSDVLAGRIGLALDLETKSNGQFKQWTAHNFVLCIEPVTPRTGCGTTFRRTICRDCTGDIVSTTDYQADGVTPYTPVGAVGPCLSCDLVASSQTEQDIAELCDVQADGTVVAFLRDYERDDTGAISGHSDYTVDGAAYTPTGAVGRCCDTTVLAECTYSLPDTNTGFALTDPAFPGCWVGTAGTPSYQFGDRVTSWEGVYQSDTGSASVVLFSSPDLGGSVNFTAFAPALPVNPAQSAAGYVGTAVINGITVTLTATAGNGLGIWQANPIGLYLNGGDAFRIEFSEPVRLTLGTSGFADPPSLHERFCSVEFATVPWTALRLADCNGNVSLVDADTREPLPDDATVLCQSSSAGVDVETIPLCVVDNATGAVVQAVRAEVVYDAEGARTATRYVDAVDGSTVALPGGTRLAVCPTVTCARQVIERCGCDDTNGDGIADASYTELWAVDPCNGADPVLLGTYLDGDLSQPYTPAAPVDCIASEVLAGEPLLLCDSGTPFLRHVQYAGDGNPVSAVDTTLDGTTPYTVTGTVGSCTAASTPDAVVSTALYRYTGAGGHDIKALHPGLQSVTLTVLVGTVEVTTAAAAAQAVPAGVTLTWSVTDTDDSVLDVFSVALTAGDDVLINATYKASAAG